jgi:hypothetical protein
MVLLSIPSQSRFIAIIFNKLAIPEPWLNPPCKFHQPSHSVRETTINADPSLPAQQQIQAQQQKQQLLLQQQERIAQQQQIQAQQQYQPPPLVPIEPAGGTGMSYDDLVAMLNQVSSSFLTFSNTLVLMHKRSHNSDKIIHLLRSRIIHYLIIHYTVIFVVLSVHIIFGLLLIFLGQFAIIARSVILLHLLLISHQLLTLLLYNSI